MPASAETLPLPGPAHTRLRSFLSWIGGEASSLTSLVFIQTAPSKMSLPHCLTPGGSRERPKGNMSIPNTIPDLRESTGLTDFATEAKKKSNVGILGLRGGLDLTFFGSD